MLTYADPAGLGWTSSLELLKVSLGRCQSFEEAAGEITRTLYTRFESATALARVYAVVPYRELAPAVAAFVDGVAAQAVPAVAMQPDTPVLTLFGTHGAKAEWCSRHTSVGHVGIPLLSAAFVEQIPMVARLLQELGFDLAGLDAAPSLNARRLVGAFNGLFHVEEASAARDAQGRLIIPAQDFVAEQQVRSVFGLGGSYPDGTLIAIIVFSRERLLRSQVDRHAAFLSLVKGETFGLVRNRRFFQTAGGSISRS